MKKISLIIVLCLLSSFSFARTLHSGPSYQITYTDSTGTLYGVTTLIRTAVTPYGTTDVSVVHIKNLKIAYFVPSVYIGDSEFTADGCGQPIAIGESCDVTVTWTPVGVSDGTIHATNAPFQVYNSGSPYVLLTIQGLAQ